MRGMGNGVWHQGRYVPERTARALEGNERGGSTPYRRGRDFERAVRQQLERRGYFVMRSTMSKGPVDLLAVGPLTARAGISGLFVQAKRTGEISSVEWNVLFELARRFGGWPVVAFRPSDRKTAYYRLDARREYRAQGRPWVAFDPGTLVDVQQPLAAA